MILQNMDSLTKSIRTMLLTASNLPNDFVRNALSKFGTALDKSESNNIFKSISVNDTMLLFEITDRDSSADCVTCEDDDSISYFKALQAKIIIYGNLSKWLSLVICAKFLSEKYRQMAISNGIYLEKTSDSQTIHEFLNDVMWPRTQFTIDFNCHFKINELAEHDFDSADLSIIGV